MNALHGFQEKRYFFYKDFSKQLKTASSDDSSVETKSLIV